MAIIDLDTATREIAKSVGVTNKNGTDSPFFFLVGAGLSVPTIPLSSEMTDLLSQRYIGDRAKLTPPSDPQAAYSFWFELTMPSAVERGRFLREMVEDKSVSPGAFALAKLLSWEVDEHPLFNLVLTTNFDDFVERGTRFLGLKHYVHAHPIALDRVDLSENSEKQIIHLHGSYKFYNCKNTNSEIDASTGSGTFEAEIVDDYFSRLMPAMMPIVIGYAGWSQDVFMKHIMRLSRRQHLQRNAYWFCHDSSALDTLPDELVEHPNIRFVADPDGKIDSVRALEGIMSELPSSTFKSSGGLFSAAVAEINGRAKADNEKDTETASIQELEESEKSVDAITLNRKWIEPMILLQNGRNRDAWNLVVCGKLNPESDAEALSLLGVLAGVAKNLRYDANVVESAKAFSDDIQVSADFGSKTADEMRSVLQSIDAGDFEEPTIRKKCKSCAKPFSVGTKTLSEQTVVNVACTGCGALYVFQPSAYDFSMVEQGCEVSFLRSVYGQ